MPSPLALDSAAWPRFAAAARAAGMDPDDRWVGGYSEYEWHHLRPLLAAYDIDLVGKRVLELGCNVGASSVVMARLGAQVSGVDVDARHVRIAQANFALHGLGNRAAALHVADTRRLPFADGQFDFVLANSVLEYVDPAHLDPLLAELHRVLAAGGTMLVCGTASRIAPREIHSGRWLVNYLPRAFDRLSGRKLQRGLSPMALARGLRGRFTTQAHGNWLAARKVLHGTPSTPMRAVATLARMLGCAPGWLSPHIELLCRRR